MRATLPSIADTPNLYAEEAGLKNPAERYLQAHTAYADASCPIPEDGIEPFVHFAREPKEC